MDLDLLTELAAAQARYGEQPQPPCPDDRRERLRQRVRAELSEEYAALKAHL